MAKKSRPKRKHRRSRFKTAADAQRQVNEIAAAQRAARKGIIRKRIDSIEKSKQRLHNGIGRIKNAQDAYDEFE
jgi:hypothetical protein